MYLKLKFTLNFYLNFSDSTINFHEKNKIYLPLKLFHKLTHTELLPFLIHDEYKHPTKLHVPYFEVISYDTNFLVEHSETSDNRPNLPSDTHTDNPHYDYDTTISQNEQIETLLDPQEVLPDTHRFIHETLEPTIQNQKTLTFETQSSSPDDNITDVQDTNTDTYSYY